MRYTTLLTTLAAFVAVVGAITTGAAWTLEQLDVKDNAGIGIYMWLVATTGLFPSTSVLLLCLAWYASRDADAARRKIDEFTSRCDALNLRVKELEDRLEQREADYGKLQIRVAQLEREAESHVSVREHVQQMLDACLVSVEYVTIEMRSEHGPRFTKAKDQHASAVHTFLRVCQLRYQKDRQFLQTLDPASKSRFLKTYIDLKEGVFKRCAEAERKLSVASKTNDEARASIQAAEQVLTQCCEALRHGIDDLASHPTAVA